MSQESIPGVPPVLPVLPDYAVLTKAQACAITNLSADSLDRLHRINGGPERVQLSPRRVGYTVGAIRKWLLKRVVQQHSAPERLINHRATGPDSPSGNDFQ
jgi:predicted DNA-binding transcriptional regulator AlpA